jgi:hypothetical protein
MPSDARSRWSGPGIGWGFAVLAAVIIVIIIGWGWGGSQGLGWGRDNQLAHMMPLAAGPTSGPASRSGAATPPTHGQ